MNDKQLSVDSFSMERHAFSPFKTTDTIFVPLHASAEFIYGWPLYVAPGTATASYSAGACRFYDRDWVRLSALKKAEADRLLRATETVQPIAGLGRICRFNASEIVSWTSTRDPELLAREAATISLLSSTLSIEASAIGISGSIHYRPRKEITDIDFVVYGEAACRVAYERIESFRANHDHGPGGSESEDGVRLELV